MKRITTIDDVVQSHLCLGCGLCEYVRGRENVKLYDFAGEGIRPQLSEAAKEEDRVCVSMCPGVAKPLKLRAGKYQHPDSAKEWGPILEIWEGYATDQEIRFRGSSGGALTAIAAYCLEKGGAHGVLHVGQDTGDPIRNRTRLSRTRAELMQAVGSRYSPGSVCNGLGLVENAPAPCVVIGRPAEIAAVSNACRNIAGLEKNIAVTLSFFCAESPSTSGTTSLLGKLGLASDQVGDLRYRGHGWPGHFAPTMDGHQEPAAKLTYQESWAFLQAYRPWSAHIWPDGAGEAADISCGDPWYGKPDGKNPGSSLIVVRTERGREILRGAMEEGYLELEPAELWKLEKSQLNLLRKKGAVWGRLLAMRLLRMPVPRHDQHALFHCWLQLGWKERAASVIGTMRRILRRKLRHPLRLDPATAVAVAPARLASHS